MAMIHKTTATLRFFGDDLDPDEITVRLAHPPTAGVRKGVASILKSGNGKIARTGMWRLTVEDRQPGDLDGQITELLGLLSDDLSVWANLTARFEASLFCGLFMAETNEGMDLSPKTMKLLGLRNLPLDLDIYDPPRPD